MVPPFSFQVQEPAEGGKPWVVLIHGLGMSHRSWSDPFKESLLGGALSFDYVLTDLQAPPDLCHFPAAGRFGCSPPLRFSNPRPLSFWEFLKRGGCGIAGWSQEKPLGTIDHAVGELQSLLKEIPQRNKIVLLGHSRGGLVARKYLQDRRPGWDRISGVILLGTPNHGSRLAKLGPFLARSFSFFGVKERRHYQSPQNGANGGKTFQIRNLAAYGREGGTAELVPGSAFLSSLAAGEAEEQKNNIPYCNIVGTRTDFIRIYLRFSPSGRGRPVISLFDGLERIIPPLFLPLEIRQGRGDGQVSAKSARLSWTEKTHLLPINHAQFLVSAEVQTIVRNFLKAI
jgi:pimeloyl-ACP methyl ester carboxylesterase